MRLRSRSACGRVRQSAGKSRRQRQDARALRRRRGRRGRPVAGARTPPARRSARAACRSTPPRARRRRGDCRDRPACSAGARGRPRTAPARPGGRRRRSASSRRAWISLLDRERRPPAPAASPPRRAASDSVSSSAPAMLWQFGSPWAMPCRWQAYVGSSLAVRGDCTGRSCARRTVRRAPAPAAAPAPRGRASAAVGALSLGVLAEAALILLVLFPGDVARMRVCGSARSTPPAGSRSNVPESVGMPALAAAAVEEGAGVTRIVQDPERARVLERSPEDLALGAPRPRRAAGSAAPAAEVLHRRRGRAGAPKGPEEEADGLLDLLVGIEDDAARRRRSTKPTGSGNSARRGALC